jgi:hypothetical protein
METAIVDNDIDVVRAAINDGFRLNEPLDSLGQRTPLAVAIEHGRTDIAILLLHNGASATAECRNLTPIQRLFGGVPAACKRLCRALLEAGVDPNIAAARKVNPPFLESIQKADDTEMLELLTEFGADINVAWHCRTAAHVAVNCRRWRCLAWLLEQADDSCFDQLDRLQRLPLHACCDCLTIPDEFLEGVARRTDLEAHGRWAAAFAFGTVHARAVRAILAEHVPDGLSRSLNHAAELWPEELMAWAVDPDVPPPAERMHAIVAEVGRHVVIEPSPALAPFWDEAGCALARRRFALRGFAGVWRDF